MREEKSAFIKYLERSLTYDVYMNIDEQLGLSPHMTTKLLKDPKRMTLEIMVKLSGLLNTTPDFLFLRFACGDEVLTDNEKYLLVKPKAIET